MNSGSPCCSTASAIEPTRSNADVEPHDAGTADRITSSRGRRRPHHLRGPRSRPRGRARGREPEILPETGTETETETESRRRDQAEVCDWASLSALERSASGSPRALRHIASRKGPQ
ncbi:hypothetical protein Cme02nite_73410 [Catellatospora methionotrophica]|uniref:Uncharacterized protein n=1 Tax=Catellatospora methionotrophica TaxID=121620 RepID=A0A8J3PJN8_9ACTN|nr:hypothetical protein Cme02nite_73410 [Catellatospora methionotrophica]